MATSPSQLEGFYEDRVVLGQEQDNLAHAANLLETEGYNGVQIIEQKLVTDATEPRQSQISGGLEGVEILAGKPVSIIAGAKAIQPDLKSFTPSITLASQVVGL